MESNWRRVYVIQLTPPGRGAVATLRVEGPGALSAVAAHLYTHSGRPLSEHPCDRIVVGHFGQPGGEEVVVCRRSDEAVELHCHGGAAAVAMIEETLLAAGCRRLEWREWASQQSAGPIAAAALGALADARTERTAAILLDQYHGALQRAMDEIGRAIDRSDRLTAMGQIQSLLARAELGRHLVRPWSVVLAGAPNVGKSSLLNALAGHRRAIVHHEPGTTRDAVTATTAIDGWPVELCDTAGLHEAEDSVERAGVELARERLATADLVILVCDRSQPWTGGDEALWRQRPGAVLVHNKCDLSAAVGNRPPGLLTCALREEGVEVLLATIAERLVPTPPLLGAAVPFTEGQVEAIKRLSAL